MSSKNKNDRRDEQTWKVTCYYTLRAITPTERERDDRIPKEANWILQDGDRDVVGYFTDRASAIEYLVEDVVPGADVSAQ